MNAVTIKDIARALNLSTSTVSRALRNSYEINPETKRLVTEYAQRVNYRPNPIALSLKENRSRFIGVVVPQLTNNFFSQVINGIEAVAYDRGYHLIILQTHESYDREVVMVEQAVARRTDGLLISLSNATSDLGHIRQLQEYNMPIVLFDRVSEQLNLPCITADNFGGAFAATEHLVQTGRRRIAHLAIPAHLSVSQERLAGYRAALEKYGLPYDETLVRHVDFFYNDVDALLTQLLTLSPDALFVSSDRLAIECLAGLKKRGIAIPEELSLLGFTNTPLADLLAPPMSAVEQPAFEMGQTATRHLIDLIEGKSREPMPSRVTMPTRMVLRASSQNPPSP